VKIVITAIVSFVLGTTVTYFYLGKSFQVVNQFANQSSFMSELSYLEMLEKGKSEGLKQYLSGSVDCRASTLKLFIKSGEWEEDPTSAHLIEKAKKYHDPKNNCHDDLANVLNQQS